mgnify:CR=1 FL=1
MPANNTLLMTFDPLPTFAILATIRERQSYEDRQVSHTKF